MCRKKQGAKAFPIATVWWSISKVYIFECLEIFLRSGGCRSFPAACLGWYGQGPASIKDTGNQSQEGLYIRGCISILVVSFHHVCLIALIWHTYEPNLLHGLSRAGLDSCPGTAGCYKKLDQHPSSDASSWHFSLFTSCCMLYTSVVATGMCVEMCLCFGCYFMEHTFNELKLPVSCSAQHRLHLSPLAVAWTLDE